MVSPPRSRVAMLVRTPVPRATCHTHTRRGQHEDAFAFLYESVADGSKLYSTLDRA